MIATAALTTSGFFVAGFFSPDTQLGFTRTLLPLILSLSKPPMLDTASLIISFTVPPPAAPTSALSPSVKRSYGILGFIFFFGLKNILAMASLFLKDRRNNKAPKRLNIKRREDISNSLLMHETGIYCRAFNFLYLPEIIFVSADIILQCV